MSKRRLNRRFMGVVALSVGSASDAFGQNFTWTNPLGGTFATASNWSPAGPPSGAAAVAVFNLPNTYTVTLNTAANHGTCAISAGTIALISGVAQTYNVSTLTLTGGTLSVNSNVVLASSGITSINASSRLSINGTGVFAPAHNLIINGGSLFRNSASASSFVLGAGRTMTVQGGGTASFTGLVELSGRTFSVTNGLIDIPTSLEMGVSSAGTLVANGAAARVGGEAECIWGRGAAADVTFLNGSAGTFGSIHLGDDLPGSLGRLSITNATLISNGLNVAASGSLGSGQIILNGATSNISQTGASPLIIGAAAGPATNGTVSLSTGTFISGTGGTSINARGLLDIGAAGTFQANGDIVVNGGTLNNLGSIVLGANRAIVVQNNGVFSATGAGFRTVNNGQTIDITSGSATFSSGLTLGAMGTDGTILVNGNSARFSAVALTTSIGTTGGAGTMVVANQGAATFTAGLAVGTAADPLSRGLLRIDSSGRVNVAGGALTVGAATGASGTILLNSGTLTASTGVSVAPNGLIELQAGTMVVGGSGLNIAGGTLRRQTSELLSLQLPAGQPIGVSSNGVLEINGVLAVPDDASLLINLNGRVECDLTNPAINVGSGAGVSGTMSVNSFSRADAKLATGTSLWGANGGAATISFTNFSAGTFNALQLGVNGGNGTLGVLGNSSLNVNVAVIGGTGAATLLLAGNSVFNVASLLNLSGVATVNSGASLIAASSVFGSTGVLHLDGATVNFGNLPSFSVGSINLASGALLWSGELATGAGGLLGANPTIGPNEFVSVSANGTLTGALVLAPLSSMTLAGGHLSIVTINGSGGTLNWSSGKLQVAAPVTIASGGAIGNQLFLDAGKTLVTSAASINSGAVIAMRGGQLLSSVINVLPGGQFLLESSASIIQGDLDNAGQTFGSGRIDGDLVNLPGGELRLSASDRIQFTGDAFNQSQVNLFGGELDVAGSFNNQAGGRVSGRGVLRTGSLANSASLLFSSGVSDVFGDLTNASGARTIVTGTAVASFYDDVINNAGSEFRVSAGSTAVFFGLVTGTSQITGTGTAVFENGTALGSIVNGGRSVVGPSGELNASVIRQVGLVVEGQINLSLAAPPSVSRLNELSIIGAPAAWEGTLDLANNTLILDYAGASPRATIANQIQSGFNGGSWNGSGIDSSVAAAQSNRAIGFAEATDLGAPATFLGDPIDATTLLLRFTLPGDCNLDAIVDIGDFSLLAANFNAPSYWARGDFNYDQITDIGDFALLAANFNQSPPLPAPALALPGSAVPEPAGAAVVLAAGILARQGGRKRARAMRT